MRASPTSTEKYRCIACEALWANHPDGTWQLLSRECGRCCDNAPMGGQMIAMSEMDKWSPLVERFRKLGGSRKSDIALFLEVRAIVAEIEAIRRSERTKVGWVKRRAALAAGSRRAKTPKAVECEASQSGGEAVTPKLQASPTTSQGQDEGER